MTTLAFVDTETTGLQHDADVWDFACIVREPGRTDVEHQFHIVHDGSKADALPAGFREDYERRYDPRGAFARDIAAEEIARLTDGAHIVGMVPDFDTTRLAPLLREHGLEPSWHYHLIDAETLAVGVLAGIARFNGGDPAVFPPWDSEDISYRLGIDPDQYLRHTALGDARWARDVYDACMRLP